MNFSAIAMGRRVSDWLGRFPVIALVLLQAVMFCLANGLLQASHGAMPKLHVALAQLLNLAAVMMITVLFPSLRAARWILFPLAAVSLYATHFLYTFGGMPAAGAYLALGRTNSREAFEYIWLMRWGLLAGACLWTGYVAAFQLLISGSAQDRFRRIRKPVLVAGLVCLAVIGNWDTFPVNLDRSRPAGISLPLKDSFPVGFVLSAYRAHAFLKTLGTGNRGFQFHATRTAPVAGREIYVLVIGESASARFWSLGGYPDPTNARLAKYVNDGALIYFPFTAAQANSTALAVPMIITAASPSQFQRATQEKSLVAAFKETGFTTYWFSNQDPASHMEEADFPVNLHSGTGIAMTNYDEDLLPLLDSVLAAPTEKAFIVLHLMGSHVEFSARVPPGFQTPPLGGPPLATAYARTICYTDFVLDQCIQRLARVQGRSFLWYVSDHGQILRQGEVGHGSLDASPSELHVPMLFWANPAYRSAAAADLGRLRQHQGEVLSQGVTFHTLLHLGGVTYPGSDPARDLCSAAYRGGQRVQVLNADANPKVLANFYVSVQASRP